MTLTIRPSPGRYQPAYPVKFAYMWAAVFAVEYKERIPANTPEDAAWLAARRADEAMAAFFAATNRDKEIKSL